MFFRLRYSEAMTRIAVLTPDPADPSYDGQWQGVLERLAAAQVSQACIQREWSR